jgi:hypothetical protein
MDAQLFHIFRNTPLGRETLLQSIYFCGKTNAAPIIYIPRHTKFLMYFDNDVVQVDLDDSYLTDAGSALDHAQLVCRQAKIQARFFEPKNFTASTLPDIPTNFEFMCCPRSVSDMSSKIGLGYIGPRVRRIVKSARFPVLITSPAFKPWSSITVFFGGSANAVNALKVGMRLARQTGMPLDLFTQIERGSLADYQKIVGEHQLLDQVETYLRQWHAFEGGRFEENLYDVAHDSLVVVGAFGHGIIRDFVFGSKMEKIQATIMNNLLIVGPQYQATS